MSIETNAAVIDGRVSTHPPAARLRNVSELRLLFAASVVLSHAATLLGGDGYRWLRIALNSEAAVQGFFILSGYLVCGSYDRLRSPAEFYKRRLLRIYPAYAVAVLLFITLGLLQATLLGNRIDWSQLPAYLAANLATLNFLQHGINGVFAGNPMAEVNGALWSIKVELMFYAVLPLLYWAGRRVSFVALALVLILAGAAWWPALNWLCAQWGFTPALSYKFQLPGQIHFFGLGIALFARSKGHISTWGMLGIIAWTLALLTLLGEGSDAVHALVLVTLIGGASVLPQVKDLFAGQDISYGIYLCHFPLIQLLIAFGAGNLPFPLYLSIVVALAVTYGLLSWRLIERPALTWPIRRAPPRRPDR